MTIFHGLSPSCSPETADLLQELREDFFILTLPAFYLAGFLLLAASNSFDDPLHGGFTALLLFLLPPFAWLVRFWSTVASHWCLLGGSILVIALLATWGNVLAFIALTALPVGLSVLLIGRSGGMLLASTITLVLLVVPPPILAADAGWRTIAMAEVWGTVWLVWMTSRSLLAALERSQVSYQQSQYVLNQARDYQLQLGEALEELAEVNLQLTRMNRFAVAMRQRAEEARTAKEQFVANVSHELRTPLNMIIGFIEMIMQSPKSYGPTLPPRLLADLEIVLRNSRHLSSLIDDVLDLSQIEAGQMALIKERCSLTEVVKAAITAVRPLYESKGLYLNTSIADDLPEIHCDRTRIRQVVLNLLSNAGRFTQAGGVCVKAWRERGAVVVSVTDTGPGLSPQEVQRIFEPFEQLDLSLRRRHGGSGLGLSISRSFIELHEGKMWVESEKERGTTFFFRLPIQLTSLPMEPARWLTADSQLKDWTHRPQIPTPILRPRLVVVEQEQALQRILSRYLPAVELVPVRTLEDALSELEQIPAQGILINELSVSEELRRIESVNVLPFDIPVIICSVPGIQQSANALGTSKYLVKPITRETLLSTLEELPLQGRTVLLVDDDADALRLFRRMLASADKPYRVLRTTSARHASTIMRKQRPDVVLIDLIMPDLDGFQFLVEKNRDPVLRGIPVVVLSAQDPTGQPIVSRSLAVSRGGGFSVRRLLATIDALLNAISPQPVDLAIQDSEERLSTKGLADEISSTEG